jgi:heme/copper-type cytochrome/quinol oxidase subunit 2
VLFLLSNSKFNKVLSFLPAFFLLLLLIMLLLAVLFRARARARLRARWRTDSNLELLIFTPQFTIKKTLNSYSVEKTIR